MTGARSPAAPVTHSSVCFRSVCFSVCLSTGSRVKSLPIGRTFTEICEPCAPGTYCAGGRATLCSPCPDGYYNEHHGRGQCKPCAVGYATYQADENETGATHIACQKCNAGTSAPQLGMKKCLG